MRTTEIDEADVYREQALVGRLTRTRNGSSFRYIVHAKNVSLRVAPKSCQVDLTPAYDLLTTLAYRGLDQRMPIKLGAQDDQYCAADFTNFAETHGLKTKPILAMLERLTSKAEPWIERLDELPWDTKTRARVTREIRARLKRLQPS